MIDETSLHVSHADFSCTLSIMVIEFDLALGSCSCLTDFRSQLPLVTKRWCNPAPFLSLFGLKLPNVVIVYFLEVVGLFVPRDHLQRYREYDI